MRRSKPPMSGRNQFADMRAAETSSARGRETNTSRGVRSCKEQFRGLHDRLGMETAAHRAVVQNIVEGDQGHSLMVRQKCADDGDVFAFRQTLRGVIERFVEAVRAASTRFGEFFEVMRRRRGVDHRGKGRGVGRDDDVFAQASLESQARHTEARVLIGQIEVAGVESRFRDSPRHIALRSIVDLAANDQLLVWLSRLPRGVRITSAGIRYSNIEPDQEMRAEPRPTGVKDRPN